MDVHVKALIEEHQEDKDLSRIKDKIEPGWDWSGCHLIGWNLSGIRFSNSECHASFNHSIFINCNLEKAAFISAVMDESNLSETALNKADFTFTSLKNANLQKSNLSGAQFEEANLAGATLSAAILHDTDFRMANLSTANLWGCSGESVSFWNTNLENSDMGGANFMQANFTKANLKGCKAWGAVFEGTNFWGADLENTDLTGANFIKANFLSAKMKNSLLIDANLSEANLQGADLINAGFNENTIITGMNLFQTRLDNSTIKYAIHHLGPIIQQERNKHYDEAREVYLSLKNYFNQQGMYHYSGDFYYREMLMTRQILKRNKKWISWLTNVVLEKTTGYGEKPSLVALWWLGIIFFSAFIYWGGHGIVFQNNPMTAPGFLDALYFSSVTFTTLGFGDIVPKEGIFQVMVILEAIWGGIFMALFIFVFARKLTR